MDDVAVAVAFCTHRTTALSEWWWIGRRHEMAEGRSPGHKEANSIGCVSRCVLVLLSWRGCVSLQMCVGAMYIFVRREHERMVYVLLIKQRSAGHLSVLHQHTLFLPLSPQHIAQAVMLLLLLLGCTWGGCTGGCLGRWGWVSSVGNIWWKQRNKLFQCLANLRKCRPIVGGHTLWAT